jgi:hypothetical protein
MALMEAIAVVSSQVVRRGDRKMLRRHVDMIKQARLAGMSEERDKQRIEDRYQLVLKSMGDHDRTDI